MVALASDASRVAAGVVGLFGTVLISGSGDAVEDAGAEGEGG